MAGTVATLVNLPVITATEVVKCRVQANPEMYKNTFDCFKTLLRQKQLLQGLFATAFREIPGYVGYFSAYQASKLYFQRNNEHLSLHHRLLSGGFAGFFSWLVCYPMDVVKTKLQVSPSQTKSLDGGFFTCAREILSKSGWRGFWVGFQACAVRGIITGAVELTLFDLLTL